MIDLIKLVREPGNPLNNPPPDWENQLIASGEQPVFYDYQHFGQVFDGFEDPPVAKIKLVWERVYFWLPAQEFCIMSLQPDNSWKETGMIYGPTQKFYLSMIDGENALRKLIAE